LPQLPLGQKITLARRGPARVAGALVADGHVQVLPIALDNPYLTEAQVLKALARHAKWSQCYNVRLALVRHPASPISVVLGYLPELTVNDLRELAAPGIVAENLRKYLQAEVQRRMLASRKHAHRAMSGGYDQSTSQAKNEQRAEEKENRGEREGDANGNRGPEETDDQA
jgi:hypothetical protein